MSPRAWYEGTVVKRLSNLLQALNYFKRHGSLNGLQYEDLMYLILLQVDYLLHENDIYTYGNHGIRQDMMLAAAVIAIPDLPEGDKIFNLVAKRLNDSAEVLFTKEGVWAEHAPGYVEYAIRLMMDLKRLSEQSDKFDAKTMISKIDTSGEYLIASLTPKMEIPWIGASESKRPVPLVLDEILKGQITLESAYKNNFNSIKYYEGYGHAILRGKDEYSPYVIFTAGHNPPAGKRHEDALSFILFNHGRVWFTEGGHNTYEPGPLTRYLRTAKAHNTYTYDNKIISEADHPELKAGLNGYQDSVDKWAVSAYTNRFKSNARVERVLEVQKEGNSMIIEDTFFKSKEDNACFQGYFQFPIDLKIKLGDLNEIKIESVEPNVIMTIKDISSAFSKLKVSSAEKKPYLGWGYDGHSFGPIQTLSYEICEKDKLKLEINWEQSN